MKTMTIEELLSAKEGENCQFKEAKSAFEFDVALKCCCALANCGGGRLVFGISDKRPRQVVGSLAFEQPERTRMGLMEKLKVPIDFQLLEHEGKRVLVFEITRRPVGIPIQANNVAWWYEGDSLISMPENVRRQIYEESGHDFSADICEGATLEDLDGDAIEAFRTAWVTKSGKRQLQALSRQQLLMDCEAMTDKGLTYAALILFGTRSALGRFLPQSEIIFEYRSSNASGPANQREDFRVGFFACSDRLWELINLRNDKQHYQEGLYVFDISTFNERVVREAILNAVCHRNYQLGGSVFLRQYQDRLVVESPGGFPHGITVDNVLDRQMPRNRRIAEIFARCGLVERSGQGMNLMYELSVREAKSLPDFTGTDDSLVRLTLNGMVFEGNMLALISQIGEEGMETLSTFDFLVINALYRGWSIKKEWRPNLKRLVEIGIVEHIGRKKYILARRLYSAVDKTGVYTRLAGLDREQNKELIHKHIRENGDKGTPLRELQQVLPGHSRGQIQVLMRELRQEKKILNDGHTSSALWYPYVDENTEME